MTLKETDLVAVIKALSLLFIDLVQEYSDEKYLKIKRLLNLIKNYEDTL